jgi:alpha-beta hydrolase superfamily lysophospholipase
MPPPTGANLLLHPHRKTALPTPDPSLHVENVRLDVGIPLAGWLFRAPRPRRGFVVYLHGLGDNRGSSLGIAQHLTARGFDVLAYDGRAQGESGGDACTYGYYEKRDLARALDELGETRVLVFGVSLGGGVAIQAAAVDPRIALVVAVSPFSDLRTAAHERAPFFASQGNIDEAFRIAEAEAHFRADEVSAVAAAAHVTAPAILVHGAKDTETPPAHAQRIYGALAGPKQLFMVPDTGHKHVLTPDAWQQIDAFIDANGPAQ